MWNPIQGVRDDWSATSGTYGKVAVVLFYLVVWLMILLNLYQATIDPGSVGQSCVFANRDAASLAWLVLLTRLWAYAMAMLFSYICFLGVKLWNIGFVTVVLWLGTGIIFSLTGSSVTQASKEDAECLHGMLSVGWSFEGILVGIWLLAYVDVKNRHEYQTVS